MSWPVRSRLLTHRVAATTGGAGVTLATVPTGKTWLLKDWRVYNAGGVTISCFIGMILGSTNGIVDGIAGIGAGQVGQHTGLSFVAPAGAELYVVITSTLTIHLYLSGAQLG